MTWQDLSWRHVSLRCSLHDIHDMTWHYISLRCSLHDMTRHDMTPRQPQMQLTWPDKTCHDMIWHYVSLRRSLHDMTWRHVSLSRSLHDRARHDMTLHQSQLTWHDTMSVSDAAHMTWHDRTWHDATSFSVIAYMTCHDMTLHQSHTQLTWHDTTQSVSLGAPSNAAFSKEATKQKVASDIITVIIITFITVVTCQIMEPLHYGLEQTRIEP